MKNTLALLGSTYRQHLNLSHGYVEMGFDRDIFDDF